MVHVSVDETMTGANAVVVDTSLRQQSMADIEHELREVRAAQACADPQADVVCVVYAVDDLASFVRVSTFWLPLVREVLGSDGLRNAIPVLVAGNKVWHVAANDVLAACISCSRLICEATVPALRMFHR